MPHRTASVCGSLYRSILLLLIAFMAAGAAVAQNLTFTPGVSTVFAGDPTGQSGLSSANYTGLASSLVMNSPGNVATDASGNLYIIEQGNNILRVVAASNSPIPTLPGVSVTAGHVYTLAGDTTYGTGSIPCTGGVDSFGNGCPATKAVVASSSGIAVDTNNNVYIADLNSNQIRVIYGGTGTLPGVSNPRAGYIYALTNVALSSAYPETGDGGPAIDAVDVAPVGLVVDSHGNIYFVNEYDTNLRMIYQGGNLPVNFFPSGVTPTPGNIYLLTTGQACTDSSGICDGEPIGNTTFSSYSLAAMTVDPSGNVYIEDYSANEIRAIYVAGNLSGVSNPTPGNIYAVAGNGTSGAPVNGSQALATPLYLGFQGQGVAFDNAGNMYFTGQIASGGIGSIFKVDPSGILTIAFGGNALCAVTPPSGKTLQTIGYNGCVATAVPNANFAGLAVDSAGNLYGSDTSFQTALVFKTIASMTALDYSGINGIPNTQNQILSISNTGTQSLQFSDIAFTGPFSQTQTGTNDCAGSTTLASGESCWISVSYLPAAVGTTSGNLTISSNAVNAINGKNTAVLSGTAVQATSSTKLVATPSFPVSANLGQSVTFTATVVPQYLETLAPTGTIAFMNGSTTLGSASLVNRVATFTTSSLAAANYSVTAVYSGDANFIASTSSAAAVTVSATPVAVVTVASSATTANSGQSVTLTATVAAYSGSGVPTGTVTFQDGANSLPNGTVTLSGGTATLTTSSLPAGNNEIVAFYSGDSQFGANASPNLAVNITAAGQLQFSPGIISKVSGSYFTNSANGPSNGTPANQAQYPSNTRNVAVDSYGNTYVTGSANYIGELWVTASGNGPIPGVTGTPVKGTLYSIGTGLQCPYNATVPCGDGGPVSQASFFGLSAISTDALNNVYVVDFGVVRKINAQTGMINTIAGMWGQNGYSGDGGPATSAKISPASIFADLNGNLYIADTNNFLIRRVDAQTGVIATVAGSTAGVGTTGPSGWPANQCITVPCGDGGLATTALLADPVGVFVDQANNLYIAESGYTPAVGGNVNVVRKVDAKTGLISIYAGQYEEGAYAQACGSGLTISCGDGGPAISAVFNGVKAIAGDNAGNIYVADNQLAVVREISAQTGIINTVIGNPNGEGGGGSVTNLCATAPCGDGGTATTALLKSPDAITLDPQGNIYIADSGTSTIREVTGATTILAYGSQALGSTTTQPVTVSNIGSTPVTFSGLTVPTPNYVQQPSGNTDCSASTVLAPAAQCQLDVSFFPTAAGELDASLTIASDAANATSGNNAIALTGTGVSAGGTQSQTITFSLPAGPFYSGQQVPLTGTADSGLSVEYEVTNGSGTILNNGLANPALKIAAAGAVTVTAYQFGNSQYAPATPVPGSLTAIQSILTITANVPSVDVNTPLPSYSGSAYYTVSGLVPGDTSSVITGQPAISVVDGSGAVIAPGTPLQAGVYTVVIAQGTLSIPSYYQVKFVNGSLNVTGTNAQTVTLASLPTTLTYSGPSTYTATLSATSVDAVTGKATGLPITYSVTGPATVTSNVLTVSGAGLVSVTAMQAGTSYYQSASATQVIQVAKASQTVTAVNFNLAHGVPLPVLSAPSYYSFGAWATGDSQTSISGQPALSIVDTKGLAGNPGAVLAPGVTPPNGSYQVNITAGTLSSANYNFNFVPGVLTINNGTSQTISFPQIPNTVYGAAPITLGASADSQLGISYTVSPPTIASLSGKVLTILGAGTVTVTATQPGNGSYAPAKPVQQSFNVAPAALTVTANDVTRLNNTPNPQFTDIITGFVNGDQQGNTVSGSAVLVTSAVTTSPVGQYPITFDTNPQDGQHTTLTAANYVFNYVSGTLTVNSGGPVSGYTLSATPQSITVAQGQIAQAQITLTPFNYYEGLVAFTCGNLPANVTCTFSPATLAPDGSNNPITTTLTINTNSAAPVVGQLTLSNGNTVLSAACFYLPGSLAGLFVAFSRRRRTGSIGTYRLLVLLVLFAAAMGLVACGGASSSSKSSLAQPGSSTITVTAAPSGSGGAAQSINIAVAVK